MDSKLNNDPQSWEVPKQVHFVWMGKRPVQALNEDTKDADGKFRAPQVLANAVANKDCMPTLWLDLLTMATRDDLQRALDPDLFVKYSRWCRLALVSVDPDHLAPHQPDPLDAPNSLASSPKEVYIKSDLTNPRDPAEFTTVITMLRQARQQFSKWVSEAKNREVFFKRKPLVDIMTFTYKQGDRLFQVTPELAAKYLAFAGMKEILSPLEIRFLDLEIYPRWMATSPTTPEYSLVNWILFELYFRRSNFGAASDLIRIQLLLDQGGIYVDHDDHIPWLHDPTRPILNGGKYNGFHYSASPDADGTIPVNSFFAAPAAHPFLRYYRQQILAEYESLLRHNYVWVDEKKPEGKQLLGAPKGFQWFDFARGWDKTRTGFAIHKNFADFTIKVSGPTKLKNCLLTVRLANCHNAKEVADILDHEADAVSTLKEREERATKTFEDAKASVLGWTFGTDLIGSGLDPAVVPGTAGAWAV